ncbi:MAG: hypothetical protein WCI73_09395, partial [Phycisphaerae bacterium]
HRRIAEAVAEATGGMAPLPVQREGQQIRLRLNLLPRGHELLVVPATSAAVAPPPASPPAAARRTPVSLSPRGIRRIRPNLLYVDYGDLAAYGQTRADLNTAAADTQNWRWQGFDGNPWDRQFRRNLIDRPVDPGTGFSFNYRFTIAPDISPAAIASLQVGLERPGLYRLDLNGSPLEQSRGERWFDENMRAFPIGQLARPGENALTLTAQPFHILCMIMPIYVLGDFALAPAARGFVIGNPVTLTMGDWTAQGLPFYPDRVRYEFGFDLAQPTVRLLARLPAWEGSVGVVLLNGREIAPVMHPPYECEIPGPLAPGSHTLALDILGSVRNMMGAHHFFDKLPLRGSFEGAPAHMPPGSSYRRDPSGLFAPPELFAIAP